MAGPNELGRTLEYAICASIIKNHTYLMQSRSFIKRQEADKATFRTIPPARQTYYSKAADIFSAWLTDNFPLDSSYSIERMTDQDGVNGDVTDVRISNKKHEYNFSIKSNHEALKHQRPGALPKQCGLTENDQKSIDYRAAYKAKNAEFIISCENDFPELSDYNQIKEKDAKYISEKYYKPICNLVTDFLNSQKNNGDLFSSFIFGKNPYYKVIVTNSNIKIYDFTSTPEAKKMRAHIREGSYIDVAFDSELSISMRLHTASTKISSCSLKFDTQLKGDMNEIFSKDF